MRFLQTAIGTEGFRDDASNPARLELLESLLVRAQSTGVRLVVLPAGFLSVKSEEDLSDQIRELSTFADRFGVGLVGGIDVPSLLPRPEAAKASTTMDKLVQNNRLPFFGFAVGSILSQDGNGPMWRQASATAAQAEMIDDLWIPGSNRVVSIDGIRIGVLICGELFNWYARENVGGANVRLVVDLGHSGMGQGLIPAMRRIAMVGRCAVVHSQHLSQTWGRSFHFVNEKAEQCSMPIEEDHVIEAEGLWAAWNVRELAI
ncbi:MAG: hypothetical protein HY289_00925 [Planctomycetes bacterium]|nr:hypothetical protein [Planctomycetota bacterium]